MFQVFCIMTRNWDRLESKKLWVFNLYKFNYKLNKLGWFCTYSYKLCGFCNGYYRFNKLNRFNLDVVNYLIQIGFKFFLDVAMCNYCIKFFLPPPPTSSDQVHFSSSSKSTNCDLKIVIDFFFSGKVTCLKFNLSLGVGNFVCIFKQWN
jgi:hypothetical protein